MEAPTRPTTCNRCGKPFNTSDQHPRRYCSIACEEGRSPLPMSDPASDGYHLHLQGEPEALVGKTVVASALKRTCYSPDWHRSPESYNSRQIVSHDEEKEILIYKTDVVVGKVALYIPTEGTYLIARDTEDGRREVEVPTSDVVSLIRRGEWWADG